MANAGRKRLNGGWWLLGATVSLGVARAVLAFQRGEGLSSVAGLAGGLVLAGAIIAVGGWLTSRSSRQARARFGPSAIRCVVWTPRRRDGFFMVDPAGVWIRKSNGKVLGHWPWDGLTAVRDVDIAWSQVRSRPGLVLNTTPSQRLLFVSPNGLRCPPELLDAAVCQLIDHGVPVQSVLSVAP